MKNKNENDMLSPLEHLDYLFEHTNEDGVFYIGGCHYIGNPPFEFEEKSYRCHVDWNLDDYDKIYGKLEKLFSNLEKIGAVWDKLSNSEEKNKKLFNNDDVFSTWKTYIKEYETEEFDEDVIYDIENRLDIIDTVKWCSSKIANDEKCDEYETNFIKNNIGVTVSKEEDNLYGEYVEAMYSDYEKRIGKGMCTFEVVNRARRWCRLVSLGANKSVTDDEGRSLVEAMVLHEFGSSKEVVNNRIREEMEMLDTLSDEELDKYYAPKKINSRKSMLPLFTYLILKEHSSAEKPMRQKDIQAALEGDPYEISVERKALSRTIHNLADSQVGIYSDPKIGTWYE